MEATEYAIDNPDLPTLNRETAANHVQRHNMAGFRAPKLDTVRVGVIGMGRGITKGRERDHERIHSA
jgi:hypothetical protein